MTIIVLAVLIGVVFLYTYRITPSNARYGEKVRYEMGTPIIFPDFILVFLGTRTEKPAPDFPNQNLRFTYYDFKLSHGGEEKTIAWSSGTGVVGPNPFEFAGKGYVLERIAASYGRTTSEKLEDNELMISPTD